jgi:hypothetical protein
VARERAQQRRLAAPAHAEVARRSPAAARDYGADLVVPGAVTSAVALVRGGANLIAQVHALLAASCGPDAEAIGVAAAVRSRTRRSFASSRLAPARVPPPGLGWRGEEGEQRGAQERPACQLDGPAPRDGAGGQLPG